MEKIYRRFVERGDVKHFSSKISSLKIHKTYYVFVLILSLAFTGLMLNSTNGLVAQPSSFESVPVVWGYWTENSTWKDLNMPSVDLNNNTTIKIVNDSEVIRIGNISSMNGLLLEIDLGGVLVIYGDLLADGSNNSDIIVNGTLIIDGNIDLKNNNDIIIGPQGVLITTGSVTVKNNFTLENGGTYVDIGGQFQTGAGFFLDNDGIIYSDNFAENPPAGIFPLLEVLNDNPIMAIIDNYLGNIFLPIDLLSFTATAGEEDIELTWSTATETNNDYFTLEKSRDGKDFELVTYLDGAGNSKDVIQYEYTDTRPYAGTSYYRLTQTDFDGTNETFPLITVNLKTDPMATLRVASVYPNAFSDAFTLQYFSPEDNPVEFKLHNLKGELVYQAAYPSHKGFNEFRFTEGAMLQGEVFVIQLIQGAHHSGPVKLLKR